MHLLSASDTFEPLQRDVRSGIQLKEMGLEVGREKSSTQI